jgi:hypothetical protein
MLRMIRSLKRRPLLQIEYQPKRRIAIQIIPVQPLTPNKAQPLIQFQTRSIRHLGLEHYLVGVARSHGIDGQTNKLRGYAPTAVFLLRGEHGDVAAVGAAAVRFEFAGYDADEGVCRGECLWE